MSEERPAEDRRRNDAEIFSRLRAIEVGIAGFSAELSAFRAMLRERCDGRLKALDNQEARIRVLEEAEHKRRGGLAALAALLTLASAAGAAIVRLWGN